MLPTISVSSSFASPFPLPSPSLTTPTHSPSLFAKVKSSSSSKTSRPPLHFFSLIGRSPLSLRSALSIEKETLESESPQTFLRESEGGDVRARFEKMIRDAQDSVCHAIQAIDKGGKFKEDVWSRPGGGGGISRVLQDGAVWEKAGVNVSVVYGIMPPEAYRAARAASPDQKPGPVPFFAAGISSVISYF